MNTFLLIISLLLNGLAIYAIIVLYSRQNRLIEVEKNQAKMFEEMEELISSYLFEMKEENEVFLKKFELMRNESFKEVRTDQASIGRTGKKILKQSLGMETKQKTTKGEQGQNGQRPEIRPAYAKNSYQSTPKLQRINIKESIENMDSFLADLDYSKESTDTVEIVGKMEKAPEKEEHEHVEWGSRELTSQVILLAKQGMSTDEIAKKLKKGKTEIELLIKFQQIKQE